MIKQGRRLADERKAIPREPGQDGARLGIRSVRAQQPTCGEPHLLAFGPRDQSRFGEAQRAPRSAKVGLSQERDERRLLVVDPKRVLSNGMAKCSAKRV